MFRAIANGNSEDAASERARAAALAALEPWEREALEQLRAGLANSSARNPRVITFRLYGKGERLFIGEIATKCFVRT